MACQSPMHQGRSCPLAPQGVLPFLETCIDGLVHSESYVSLQAGSADVASVASDSMSCSKASGTRAMESVQKPSTHLNGSVQRQTEMQ